MAGVLKITNGTDEVDLLDATGLYLAAEPGWRPAVADEDDNGDYLPMVEVIPCTWMETDDDDRAETIKKIKRLDRQARLYTRRNQRDKWVWIEASTTSETDTRYGIISKIQIPDGLSDRLYGPNAVVDVTLVITHELWWHIAPNGTPETIINAQTIYNADDATRNNYLEIDGEDIKGDAPALTIFEVDYGVSGGAQFFISKRIKPNMANYRPYIYVDDSDYSSGFTTYTDTTLPGGKYMRATGTTTGYVECPLPAEANDFQGEYLLFCLARTSTDETTTLYYAAAYQGLGTPNDPPGGILMPVTTPVFSPYYLGKLTILSQGAYEGVTLGHFELGMRFVKSSACNADFASFILIQVDEGVFFAEWVDDIGVIDGKNEVVYSSDTGGDLSDPSLHTWYGDFVKLTPNEDQRLYFYDLQYSGTQPGGWQSVGSSTGQYEITLKVIHRYTSLRGND